MGMGKGHPEHLYRNAASHATVHRPRNDVLKRRHFIGQTSRSLWHVGRQITEGQSIMARNYEAVREALRLNWGEQSLQLLDRSLPGAPDHGSSQAAGGAQSASCRLPAGQAQEQPSRGPSKKT